MIHLRVFGSVAYQHVLNQLREKIVNNGEKMILVGYYSTSGYKLYDVANMRTMISRDFIFDEIK